MIDHGTLSDKIAGEVLDLVEFDCGLIRSRIAKVIKDAILAADREEFAAAGAVLKKAKEAWADYDAWCDRGGPKGERERERGEVVVQPNGTLTWIPSSAIKALTFTAKD